MHAPFAEINLRGSVFWKACIRGHEVAPNTWLQQPVNSLHVDPGHGDPASVLCQNDSRRALSLQSGLADALWPLARQTSALAVRNRIRQRDLHVGESSLTGLDT